jgi:hypothetical protein
LQKKKKVITNVIYLKGTQLQKIAKKVRNPIDQNNAGGFDHPNLLTPQSTGNFK